MKRNFKVPRPAVCSVDGCGKLRRSLKGFCESHYRRWKTHGHPLAGGQFRNAVTTFYHETVLQHQGDECLIWPFSRDRQGYGYCGIDGKTRKVSRMVCEATGGPQPTPEHVAAHYCGNSGCVNPRHIRWATPVENEADKIAHGTSPRGENQWSAKLTASDVLRIRELTKRRVPQKKIAAEYNVTTGAVSSIHRGLSWAWLPNSLSTEG